MNILLALQFRWPAGVVGTNFSQGGSLGYSDCPGWRSLEGQSEYLRDLPWKICPDNPKAFPLFVRLWNPILERGSAVLLLLLLLLLLCHAQGTPPGF